MAQPKKLASIGSVVLVSRDPGHEEYWLPAIVEKAGNNQQIVCTAFTNGNAIYFEGCRHVSDPWWQEDGSVTIAIQEGIGAWKLRPEEREFKEAADYLISAAINDKTPQRQKATAKG
jgi:hypothetical protein